jgi:hypothetical protein
LPLVVALLRNADSKRQHVSKAVGSPQHSSIAAERLGAFFRWGNGIDDRSLAF